MEKKYISETILRAAQPRSKRLQGLGVRSENGVTSTVVSVEGSSSSASIGDGHTHSNKTMLDEISTDDDRYIYLKKLEESDDGTTYESVIAKAKAGYADKAHDIDDDSPVYSKFVRKDVEDTAAELITFMKGLLIGRKNNGITVDNLGTVTAIVDELKDVFSITSPGFTSGDLGTGFIIKYDPAAGKSYMEVDELLVRKLAYFVELVIKRLSYVGGEIILTPASMKCVKVEEDNEYYRCYFNQDDGEKSIINEFKTGDLVRAQTFNVKEGTSHNTSNRFYWRLVVGIGDDYIDLSKSDCHTDSGSPEAGDSIVQLGNRTDATRQNAIILSSVGDDAPSIKQYKGIDSYSLTGKEVTIISPLLNKFVGQFISEATGKSYDDMISSLQADFDIVKAQTDREYTLWFFDYVPTLNNVPASEWTTEELKAMHDQDMFYNTSNVFNEGGRAWRFEKNEDSTYSWNDITDQQTVKALENAAKAQDTADGKRRVFVEQPTDEQTYDVGDLWVNATYPSAKPDPYENDTLVCRKAKNAGVMFDIDHWKPANYGTTATIKNMGNSIEAVVRKFNEDGTLKSGLIAKSDFASLFASQVREDENIVKQADINVFIKKDENGVMESGVKIEADQINFIGKTVISGGKFTVDDEGNVSMVNATISGSVIADKGMIGAFKIDGNGLVNSSSDNPLAYILIEKNGGQFFRVNESSYSPMCAIRGDGKTALSISAYGNNSIGIDCVCQAGYSSIAIRSFGDVEMTARSTESLQFKGPHTYIEGMTIKVMKIFSETTLDLSVGWVTCTNQSRMAVYLPLDPPMGKILYLMRTDAQVDVYGNGINISIKGDIREVLEITNRAEINFFLYDGTYWMNGWFNGTV